MGKMKDALARLAKKVTGKEVEDTNSMSNILEEMVDGFDVDTSEEVNEKINEAVSSVYKYKGSVATYDDLPMTGRKSGDVYNVADTGKNYAYNGSSWDDIGGSAVLVVTDITGLTSAQCDMLNAGDRVIKLTGNQKHTYTVSYKEANVGMCLTYTDASVVETVSYDYVSEEWVYNSTDSTPLGGGDSKLYHHAVKLFLAGTTSEDYSQISLDIYSRSATPFESVSSFIDYCKTFTTFYTVATGIRKAVVDSNYQAQGIVTNIVYFSSNDNFILQGFYLSYPTGGTANFSKQLTTTSISTLTDYVQEI